MKCVLAIDIGNTNVACALFSGRRLVKRWSMRTDECRDMRALALRLRAAVGARRFPEGACIVNVVPRLDPIFRGACKVAFGVVPLFANHNSIPMRIRGYDKKQLGADRLVAAFAAYQEYRKPVIIIDAGTAITIDLVSARGEFAGGVIVPGLSIAAASLHAMTAKLPLVKPRLTARAIGRNTREAINSGLIRGYAGLVDGIVRSIARQSHGKPLVIATGGDAILLKRSCRTIRRVHPDLILRGLDLLWENYAWNEVS